MLDIKIPTKTLLKAIDFASTAIKPGGKGNHPIQQNLLIVADEKSINITGSGSENELEYRQPVTDEITVNATGKITLPAKKLKALVKSAPKDSVVSLKPEKNDRYKLSFSGLRSRYMLHSLPADNFPNISISKKDAPVSFELDAATLLNTVSTVSSAMAQGDVRYYLNGLQLMTVDGRLALTATDGHRLAQNKMDFLGDAPESLQAILPRDTAQSMEALFKGAEGTLSLVSTKNHLFFKLQDNGVERVVKSNLIDGRFPEWQRVIPTAFQQSPSAPVVALRDSLNRATILSNEKNGGIRLQFSSDKLLIESQNPDNESASEEVDITSGEALEIGFNVHLLSQALTNYTSESVNLYLNSETDSMMIHNPDQPDLKYIIMPMRL